MKNILENKTKFFAQYWGQEVLTLGTNDNYPIIKSWISCLMEDSEANGDYKQLLKLKPISSITDEDALQLSEFIGYRRAMKFDMRKKAKMIVLAKEYLEKYAPVISAGDYLRSKGYALPYMGLSVEKQVEYGWIKLS